MPITGLPVTNLPVTNLGGSLNLPGAFASMTIAARARRMANRSAGSAQVGPGCRPRRAPVLTDTVTVMGMGTATRPASMARRRRWRPPW